MANLPSYDPANYGDVESASVYQNNVISNAYEPGSVMKLFTVGTGAGHWGDYARVDFLQQLLYPGRRCQNM